MLQYNHTIYDQDPYYKTGIAGLGIQLFSGFKNKLRPTLEINADVFNKREIGSADESIEKIALIPSAYIGPSYHPTDRFFISTTVGVNFYDDLHFGVRPSVGIYPCSNKKLLVKISFTNVFQELRVESKDFGYLSFALALKL